jgi:hypothetical protein
MPFYHPKNNTKALQFQEFLPNAVATTVEISAKDNELNVKQEMFSCHKSQALVIADFMPTMSVERFRLQPSYEYWVSAIPGQRDYPVSPVSTRLVADAMIRFQSSL